GPPGTGRRTVVTKAAQLWRKGRSLVYIAAQSNIAVKNIAEKLFKKGVNFKIIESKEFHFGWHEHSYIEIETCVIRSDMLDGQSLDRLLGGSEIILTTLRMLSNLVLDKAEALFTIPMEKLVIDEASQINVFEYMVRIPIRV
ncbi:hypothetical protein M422DRAFT_164892, partial [Sphaerobolus stellatus SS14]